MNKNEQKWTEMNRNEQNEQKWNKINKNEQIRTNMKQNEKAWTKMNKHEAEVTWTITNEHELTWNKLEQTLKKTSKHNKHDWTWTNMIEHEQKNLPNHPLIQQPYKEREGWEGAKEEVLFTFIHGRLLSEIIGVNIFIHQWRYWKRAGD